MIELEADPFVRALGDFDGDNGADESCLLLWGLTASDVGLCNRRFVLRGSEPFAGKFVGISAGPKKDDAHDGGDDKGDNSVEEPSPDLWGCKQLGFRRMVMVPMSHGDSA